MEGKPTREQVFAEPPGEVLDGWVEDALGIERRSNTPSRRMFAVWDARAVGEPYGDPDKPDPFVFAGERWEIGSDRKGPRNPDGIPPEQREPWVWLQREGKPWQAALEAHVAAWRAPPSRSWSGDIAAALEAVERVCCVCGHSDFHLSYDCGGPPDWAGAWHAHFPGPTDAAAATAAEAVAKAVVLAWVGAG